MAASPDPVYVFGSFRLDPGRHLLLREGEAVSLPPKAFAVLLQLVEAQGRLVAKEELFRTVWADSFVEEGTLKQHVSILRRALKDDENGDQYIETVPRLGYRFVSPVQTLAAPSAAAETTSDATPAGSRGEWRRLVAAGVGLLAIAVTVSAVLIVRGTSGTAERAATEKLPRRLTFNVVTDFQPDWSPDGRKIAFMSTRDGRPEIYVMDADGRSVANLTRHPAS